MYIGAAAAVLGAAIFYRSLPLLGYVAVFLLVMHAFVRVFEEPTLRQMFRERIRSLLPERRTLVAAQMMLTAGVA